LFLTFTHNLTLYPIGVSGRHGRFPVADKEVRMRLEIEADAMAWAQVHFGGAELGDARRSKGSCGWRRQ